MKLLPIMMYFMSILFVMSSHPIILMVIILTQAIIICLISWLSFNLSWFSFILFLIFLGGLMVLFIYISSLASNEKFYLKFNNLKTMCLFIFPLMMFYLYSQNNMTHNKSESISMKFMFNEMYFKTMMLPSALTMIFLLLTLVVVVKISSKYEGPMRNMIFK